MAHFGVSALAPEAAGDVQKAAKVAGENRVGSRGNDITDFIRDHADGNVREYLTQKVPPNPRQQTSASAISVTLAPIVRSRRRGCSLMPSSRRPEQLS